MTNAVKIANSQITCFEKKVALFQCFFRREVSFDVAYTIPCFNRYCGLKSISSHFFLILTNFSAFLDDKKKNADVKINNYQL